MTFTIIIADDHELVRESIISLLKAEPDFQVIAQCADGHDLLELVERLNPDVAVIDIAMPKLNGIEAARRIRKVRPDTRVILLSSYADEAYVRGTIEAGAVAYITKSGAVKDLIQAIRVGTRREIYLSDEVSAVARSLRSTDDKMRNILTPREREILQLIAEGRTSKGISALLGIGETTVKTHRNNIMDKLDIRDKAGLTRYAIRVGLTRVD